MQTPPETMLPKESSDLKTKPVEAKKEEIVPKPEDVPKAPSKEPEQKPPTAGNGGEAVKTVETNSKAEPKAKTPEAAEAKPTVTEQPKPAPKEIEKEEEKEQNSKPESPPKPPAEEVSASKAAEETPAEDEPMDTQDGGDDDEEKKKVEKEESKKETSVEAKEEKLPAKRGRKRKAEIQQKDIEVETSASRTKRTREVSEEKEATTEKRSGRKRAAKTEVSMREAPGSEDEYEPEEDDKDEDEEPVKKKRGRGRPPKSGKPAVAKQVKHTGPTLEIPTIDGNTIACAAGDGEVGQLGIGEGGENGKNRFVAIDDIPDKVVRCAAGGMHSLLLTEKGEIYSFGCNDDGSLGRPTDNEEDCFVPKLTKLPEPVAKLAAGNIHSVAVTKHCKVFIWGSYRDNNGAFGIQPDGDAPLKLPTELKVPETIVDVACGSEHTLLLSNKGNIFSMGVGEQGRLGRLKSSHCGRENRRARQTLLTPVIVPVRKRKIKFDRIWAGRYNSFARTTDGAIWGCGLNNYGQLGELDAKSMEDNFVFFLTELKSFDPKIKWEQICGGEQHTLALDAEGSVYSMGRVLYGRLGLGKKDDNDPDVKKPTLIPELEKKCTLIAAGDHTSFALDKDGQLWSWGQGTNLLGQGSRDEADTIDVFVPTACTSKALREHKVVFASAGSNHALCVVKSE